MSLRAAVAALASAYLVVLGGRSPFRFTDVAQQSGLTVLNIAGTKTKSYLIDSTGNGAAFLDYDRDGNMDVLIVNGSSLERLKNGGDQMVALYHNDGGGKFTDVTARAGLSRRGWGMGTCVADYDNDGFPDIYVTAFGSSVLWHNTGKGTFTDSRQAVDTGWSTGCASATTTTTAMSISTSLTI